MENSLILLAASIGFFHTLFGLDHYVPFIAMSKANKWSLTKTALVTLICGTVHVLSSVFIGIFGIWFGLNVLKLEAIESFRGRFASWLLILFGIIYFIWAIRELIKDKTNYKESILSNKKLFWTLFIIFILGPCEPLIPILMFPALINSFTLAVVVTLVFYIVTISTMLGIVMAASYGLNLISFKGINRFVHVIASTTICFCGLTIKFLGI